MCRVWCCSQSGTNQGKMEQIVVNGSESQVVVDDSSLLQKKISAIRLGGHAKLQVNLTLLGFLVLLC